MATVTRRIVDVIIANDGIYPGDDMYPVIKIVRYNNQWNGGVAYGLIYRGEDPMRYHTSAACHNPETIWEYCATD
jgi:hypothetical protein